MTGLNLRLRLGGMQSQGNGHPPPANVLTFNGQPLTYNGQYLTLGGS